ncbi:MAG TPA: ABC transporter ATP-binding protein [Acidimicrobiales bacterium]|nr:ABC transporter ATP-binding protein [Acidimicrobiales bacterium]
MAGDLAIAVGGLWKSYRKYEQRSHTLKERVLRRAHRYEEFWALREVDLEVPAGTALGIIGANGSGKSTLLKTMAGILTPDRGSVEVEGAMSSLLELGTGFHPELTGRENVYLGGSLLGMRRHEVAARYDEIVDFAGIEPFMDVAVKNYSSGMYARLAFALAVSVDPEILVVDEVLSVGDEAFQMRCFERIAQLRTGGRTIVLVSHSLDTIRSLCTSAVWLDGGTVRERGRAHDVVAAYLGEVHATASHDIDQSPDRRGNRWGSGEVEITDVAFVDGEGAAVGAFRTGEPMTVRLHYRATEARDDVVCGVAVHRADTLVHLFGENTRGAGVPLRLAGEGTIEVLIPSLPFLKGAYVVTVALHDATMARVFDWHERRYSFLVFENPDLPTQVGSVHVPLTWRVSASTMAV